jgi:hypothetical protein
MGGRERENGANGRQREKVGINDRKGGIFYLI